MKTRPKKTMIGTADCSCCGREIPVRQSETGTLDMSCHWCDLPLYAKKDTEAHTRLMARVRRLAAPDPDPVDPVHVPPVEVKPVARATRSALSVLAGMSE